MDQDPLGAHARATCAQANDEGQRDRRDRDPADRETYQHVSCPEQDPGAREIRWHQTKPSGAGSLPERIARKLESEERLITSYGGTRVRMDLDRIPLWTDRDDIAVEALWGRTAGSRICPGSPASMCSPGRSATAYRS